MPPKTWNFLECHTHTIVFFSMVWGGGNTKNSDSISRKQKMRVIVLLWNRNTFSKNYRKNKNKNENRSEEKKFKDKTQFKEWLNDFPAAQHICRHITKYLRFRYSAGQRMNCWSTYSNHRIKVFYPPYQDMITSCNRGVPYIHYIAYYTRNACIALIRIA